MKVLICYDTGHDYGSFTYFSQYDRINAKGVKEEAQKELIKRKGSGARDYKITGIYRED